MQLGSQWQFFLPVYRRVGWLVLVIVQVYLINTRHGTDNIQGALQHRLIILQHGVVKRSFDDGTYIVAILADGPVVKIHVNRPENQVEQDKHNDQ